MASAILSDTIPCDRLRLTETDEDENDGNQTLAVDVDNNRDISSEIHKQFALLEARTLASYSTSYSKD